MAILPVYAIMPATLAITGVCPPADAVKLFLKWLISEELITFQLQLFQLFQHLDASWTQKETHGTVCVSCDEYTFIVYSFTHFS
jgi:hypothetical protein